MSLFNGPVSLSNVMIGGSRATSDELKVEICFFFKKIFSIEKYREFSFALVTLLPAVHFLEQAFAGADFSTEKFSAALSLISAALFQCPKIAKFSVAHFLNFCAISVALFQLPKVVKFSVAHLQTSERVQN